MRMELNYLAGALISFAILPGYLYGASARPSSMAELALYRGADRQQLLEEGAKKERNLTFYTGGILTQGVRPTVDAFEKQYPFIKVTIWRGGSDQIVAKVAEESKSGNHLVDVMEITQEAVFVFQKTGIVTPFHSPNFIHLEEEALTKGPADSAYAATFYSSGAGFGYNAKMVRKDQVPKTYQDLLDPRWKGKMTISGSSSAINWANTIYRHFGEEFLKRIAEQGFVVHMVSARAILDLIINGENPASPVIFGPHVFESKKKGAPVDWVPLEPVYCNVMNVAVAKNAPHPHAAMLLADFQLSQKVSEIQRDVGYDTFRKDVPSLWKRYKKDFGYFGSMEDVKKQHEMFEKYFLKK